MHNTAFQLLGLDCQYEALDIEPTSLKQASVRFRDQVWGGFNVTTPHKETIIPLIDKVIPKAQAIGAVNTIVNSNNALIGHNTDIIGVERSLRFNLEKIEGQECTILGSGGAARSVAYVLTQIFKPKAITFSVLFPEQAYAIIKSIDDGQVKFNVIHCTDTKLESVIKNSKLIVNATTVGMYPNVLDSPIANKNLLSNQQIIFDLIYHPLRTRLLDEAKSAGASTIGGLEMFIHQGAAAFQLWTGMEMPIDQVRCSLEDKLSAENT
jgi:shikimate dehydrogenase